MKTVNKVLLILAGVFLALGIAVITITGCIAASHGTSLFGELRQCFHWIPTEYESEANVMTEKNTIDLSGVKGIQLTGNYGKVEIVKGDRLSYEVYGNEMDSSLFTHDVVDGIWRINVKNRSGFYFFGIGSDDHISKLRITIPSTQAFDMVSIKLSAGSVSMDRLAAKTLRIEMGAGSLDANELVGEDKISLAVSAGKCKVKNIIGKDSYFRCDAGQIDATGILTGNSEVKCGVGQINLNVVGNRQDYDYKVDCGIGQIRIDGQSASGISNSRGKVSGASNTFNMDCGIGQINLDFIKPNK